MRFQLLKPDGHRGLFWRECTCFLVEPLGCLSRLQVLPQVGAPDQQCCARPVWNVCPGHIGTYSLGVIGLLRLELPETAGFPVSEEHAWALVLSQTPPLSQALALPLALPPHQASPHLQVLT